MQSASDLPPPPGLLGADVLALALPAVEVPGERASEDSPVPEEPPPVANWLGKGSDIGASGGTADPGCAVVGEAGVVVAVTPPGGVSPAEGVDDNDVDGAVVDGAAGVVGGAGTLRVVVGKLVVGADRRELGAAAAPPAEERA